MAQRRLGGSGRAAMAEHSWRSWTTLTTFYIAAGTLAAAHCSLRSNHCADSPNSGSELIWGISLTQDSRDSFIDSGCHSNMVAVGQMSVPSRASAHRVDGLQAMLDCYASLPFSASAELGRLASSCSACSFRGFNTMCSSVRQISSSAFSRGGGIAMQECGFSNISDRSNLLNAFRRNCYRRDPGLPASSIQSHLAASSAHLQKPFHLQN